MPMGDAPVWKATAHQRDNPKYVQAQAAAVDSLVAMARMNKTVLGCIVQHDTVQKHMRTQWAEIQAEALGKNRDASALHEAQQEAVNMHAAMEAAAYFSSLSEYYKARAHAHGAACDGATHSAAYADAKVRETVRFNIFAGTPEIGGIPLSDGPALHWLQVPMQ